MSSDRTRSRRHNQSFGRHGEDRAAQWYVANGYKIVERNWRCRHGELDLIASKPGLLVFCEVKSRSSEVFGSPLEAVTIAKMNRIRRLAVLFLAERVGAYVNELRFDVASVTTKGVEVLQGVS